MTEFSITANAVLPKDKVKNVKEFVTNATKQIGISVSFKEEKVETTNLVITFSVNAGKAIKELLRKSGAPENEINALSKIKSVVESTLGNIANNILQQLQGHQK